MNWVYAMMAIVVLLSGMCGCHTAGDQRRAIANFESDLRERSERRQRAETHYEKGVAAYDAGDSDSAYARLQRAAETDPTFAAAQLALGVVAYEQGDLYKSASALSEAARLAPGRYEPYYNKGLVFEAASQHQRAIAAYRQALRRSPDEIHVKQNLIRCYVATGENPGEAAELVEQALQKETRPEWRAWLRRQAMILQNIEQAETSRE